MPEVKKIEVILWMRCNTPCVFCTSGAATPTEYTFDEAVHLLREWRDRGAESVAFGGGEPTTFRDLPGLASAARDLGYSEIEIKSNGMRFCYPEYAQACMQAGVTHFTVSLWGHTPEVHDRLAGRPRTFEMTEMGLKHLVHYETEPAVDFLVTTHTVEHLEDAVGELHSIGVRHMSAWVFCLFGAGGRLRELMPSLSLAGHALAHAAEAFPDMEISTTHITPCCMQGRADLYRDIKEQQLLIVMKNHSFMAEESPFEKASHIAACEMCALRQRCAGPREEYVQLAGQDEFQPVE